MSSANDFFNQYNKFLPLTHFCVNKLLLFILVFTNWRMDDLHVLMTSRLFFIRFNDWRVFTIMWLSIQSLVEVWRYKSLHIVHSLFFFIHEKRIFPVPSQVKYERTGFSSLKHFFVLFLSLIWCSCFRSCTFQMHFSPFFLILFLLDRQTNQ